MIQFLQMLWAIGGFGFAVIACLACMIYMKNNEYEKATFYLLLAYVTFESIN